MSEGLELSIDVSINDYQRGGGNLRLSERMTVPAADFGTLAKILGRFHELLAAIKEAQEAPHE